MPEFSLYGIPCMLYRKMLAATDNGLENSVKGAMMIYGNRKNRRP